ncbi:MAG: PIN domain-containing protein [Bacteroidota bacterium]
MKIFIDANILVSVLNKEYPLFTQCARVLSLAENKSFDLYTSPICFAIAFYFASKKSGEVLAKKKMAILAGQLKIAENRQGDVLAAANHKKILDFEDGLEYYAAKHSGCRFIVTEDVADFHFSDIEVVNSETFLNRHVLKMQF